MTRDVKESLTAWISVSLLFAFLFVSMRVMDRFPPPPKWAVETLQGVQLLLIAAILSRWLWRRRQLRRTKGGAR